MSGKQWLTDEAFPDGLNKTNILLILKIKKTTCYEKPEADNALQCAILYKIVSKVLYNRLQKALPELVDKAQSAFVEGRSIQDNAFIAFKAIIR